MALWRCKACGTKFAVGLRRCPQCTGTNVEEDGMPKITRHGGPSIASGPEAAPTPSDPEANDVDDEGSEQPSPGNSSETSPEKPPTSGEPSEPDPPKPARTTARRSSKGRKASSSARSTATSGRETEGGE